MGLPALSFGPVLLLALLSLWVLRDRLRLTGILWLFFAYYTALHMVSHRLHPLPACPWNPCSYSPGCGLLGPAPLPLPFSSGKPAMRKILSILLRVLLVGGCLTYVLWDIDFPNAGTHPGPVQSVDAAGRAPVQLVIEYLPVAFRLRYLAGGPKLLDCLKATLLCLGMNNIFPGQAGRSGQGLLSGAQDRTSQFWKHAGARFLGTVLRPEHGVAHRPLLGPRSLTPNRP